MTRTYLLCSGVALLAGVSAPVAAQRIIPAAPESAPVAPPPYPEVAELVDSAPLVIDATVRSAEQLHGKEALGTPPGTARMLVTADVGALIRGNTALSARITYLWLAPTDPQGHIPRVRKAHMLLFADTVPGLADQVRLVRRDAQRPWSAALSARVTAIAREEAATDAPPRITGVGHAFHSAGTLPGEGTTQIFLRTADQRPISLTVERTADGARSWTVALGDIVGAGAPPPARDTLLWFRLACFLPATLSGEVIDEGTADDKAAATADYAWLVEQLGPCSRGVPAG